MKKSFKINELGRSMVEMLGVLAVIGVLSIGAIQGYKYAFNKYNANETINELNLRANDISQRMERLIELNHVGNIDMEMGNITRTGYPIRARMHPQFIDFFEMFVSDVPSDVCKQLLQSNWDVPFSIFVNIVQYENDISICDQTETVEIAYEFHKDFLSPDDMEEAERHEIQRCNHDNNCKCGECSTETGLCESYCSNRETCSKNYEQPAYLMCCPNENVVNGICCAGIDENGQCCQGGAVKCCPPEKPLIGANGTCYSCDDNSRIDVTGMTTNCNVCENRFIQGNACVKQCPDGQFMDKDGYCRSCNSSTAYPVKGVEHYCNACPNRMVDYADPGAYCYLACDTAINNTQGKPLNGEYGNCYSCDVKSSINVNGINKGRCSQICPNRVLNGYMCVLGCSDPNKPLLVDTSGTCKDCNHPDKINVSFLQGECSALCPNREVKNGYCVLKECADGYFKDKEGACRSCSSATAYPVQGVETNCDVCPNRFVDYAYPGAYCYLKCDSEENGTQGKKLNGEYGTCYSCDVATSINVNGKNMARCSKLCPNRVLNGNMCVLGCSDPSKPLLADTAGTCKDCDYPDKIPVSFLQGECSTLCPNREVKNGYCILKECAEGYFMDKDGACRSCNSATAYPVQGVESNCDVCPNRMIDYAYPGAYCYLECDSEENGTQGKPLNGEYGNCYSCNTQSSINVNGKNMARCSQICPNRKLNGSMCNWAKCSEDKQLLGSNGTCYECNIVTPIKVASEDDCKVCLNRTYNNGYCTLIP